MHISASVFVAIVSLFGTLGLAAPTPGVSDAETLAQRAVLSAGDTSRLAHVLAKARRGESVTIGAIGGSITQGAKASDPSRRYASLVTDWWRRTFPQAKIELINAGIGATGSHYGALRAQRDLLARQPDFVIVDFAVNDKATADFAETIEGLVRQILKQPNAPAVVLLFMMKQDGSNAQFWHAQVGAHYELPMISYRDALWPELQAARLTWPEISPDDIHPNDRGMALAADFVIHFLAHTLRELPAARMPSVDNTLRAPLFSDRFEHVALFEGSALAPVANSGWSYDEKEKSWNADQPGSVIEFVAPGQSLALMYYRLRGAMGRAKVQVDGAPAITLDAWFPDTWGGYRDTITVADKLSSKQHKIRIELVADHDPASTGHEFRIMGLGAAGLDAP